MKMERNLSLGKGPLPGDCQGMFGAGAEHDTMRTGGRMLRRRVPATQQATAQEDQMVEEEGAGSRSISNPSSSSSNLTSEERAAGEGSRNRRIKWTLEMNRAIIYCFYRVNRCEEIPLPGYRYLLFSEFKKLYPELHISEQNISDRRNVILRKNYLSSAHLEEIKREVGNELDQNLIPNQAEDQIENEEQDENLVDTMPEKDHSIREKFLSFVEFYRNSEPKNRPFLPKLKNIKNVIPVVNTVNEYIAECSNALQNLEDIHLALYCGAATVLELNKQDAPR